MNLKPSSKRRQAYPLINDEVYPIVILLDRHSAKMENCDPPEGAKSRGATRC